MKVMKVLSESGVAELWEKTKEMADGVTKTAADVQFDNEETELESTNVQGAIEELFTSVADGKEMIASAISDKGVPTEKDATFEQMKNNILAINTGGGNGEPTGFRVWTPIPELEAKQTNFIAFGGGNFICAVPRLDNSFSRNSNLIYSSDNGVSWQDVENTNFYNGAAYCLLSYGNGIYVFLYVQSYTLYVRYSTDLVNWKYKIINPPASGQFDSIAFGNNTFCIATSGSQYCGVMHSTDVENWTEAEQLRNNSRYSYILFADGEFYLLPTDTSKRMGYKSADCVDWKEFECNNYIAGDGRLEKYAYGNGKFVGIGEPESPYYSEDCINWYKCNWPAINWPVSGVKNLSTVYFGGGVFVVLAGRSNNNGYIAFTSKDAINWEATFLPYSSAWSYITYGNGRFIANSYSNTPSECHAAYMDIDVSSSEPEQDKDAKVYGVMWDSSDPSTVLTRLTSENDDNGYVNTNIATNPVAAVGAGYGSSPFDDLYPWVEMEEYNIIDNAVSYKQGQDGFSRTNHDTMVYIPEFWYKAIKNDDKWYWYISDKEKGGFEKHPGSGRYVGRYNTGADYVSKSSLAPLCNITRADARDGSHNKGDNWYQYDYATWCAVWLLYLVEFADWDSQKVIGQGIVNDSAVRASGRTDSMSYHTGRPTGTDGKTAVQYRHIENPWGNVYEWIDGINIFDYVCYISLDNANFKDDTTEDGYTSSGVTLVKNGGYKTITDLGDSAVFPFGFYPISVSEEGSTETYIPDYAATVSGYKTLIVGGYYKEEKLNAVSGDF